MHPLANKEYIESRVEVFSNLIFCLKTVSRKPYLLDKIFWSITHKITKNKYLFHALNLSYPPNK